MHHLNTLLAVYGASLSTLLFALVVLAVVYIGRKMSR